MENRTSQFAATTRVPEKSWIGVIIGIICELCKKIQRFIFEIKKPETVQQTASKCPGAVILILLLLIIASIVYCLCCRNKQKYEKQENATKQPTEDECTNEATIVSEKDDEVPSTKSSAMGEVTSITDY